MPLEAAVVARRSVRRGPAGSARLIGGGLAVLALLLATPAVVPASTAPGAAPRRAATAPPAGAGPAQHAAPAAARAVRTGPRRFEAVVTHVSDGDTLWARPLVTPSPASPPGTRPRRPAPVKLRFDGIDAPELCQAHGPAARQALAERVLGRQVQVETRATDRYGRGIARLQLQGEDLGGWMVASGHAWGLRSGQRGSRYAAEHRAAERAARGLFADRAARPPAEFRRLHGPCSSPGEG